MHRCYIAGGIEGQEVIVTEAGTLHHLRDVLRLKAGDEVAAFDGGGSEYTCVIAQLRKDRAVLEVKAARPAGRKKTVLAVACAIPKRPGLDEVVDGLTQLGVDLIIPMETERVVVRLDDAARAARLERWRRIARGAAEQSQRPDLPQLSPVTDFGEVVAGAGVFSLRLLPHLSGEKRPIHEVMAGQTPASILVLIGPEGDFTPEEVAMARDAGFVPVSLGASVLRVGTAALAVASYLRLSLGL